MKIKTMKEMFDNTPKEEYIKIKNKNWVELDGLLILLEDIYKEKEIKERLFQEIYFLETFTKLNKHKERI